MDSFNKPTFFSSVNFFHTEFTSEQIQEQPAGLQKPVAVKNSQGTIELYSIGGSGSIYHTRIDSSTLTGWNQVNTGLSASSLCVLEGKNGTEEVYFYTPEKKGMALIHRLLFNSSNLSYSSEIVVPAHEPLCDLQAYSETCFYGTTRDSRRIAIVADLNADFDWKKYIGPALSDQQQKGSAYIVAKDNVSRIPGFGDCFILNNREYTWVTRYEFGGFNSENRNSPVEGCLAEGTFVLHPVLNQKANTSKIGIYDEEGTFNYEDENLTVFELLSLTRTVSAQPEPLYMNL